MLCEQEGVDGGGGEDREVDLWGGLWYRYSFCSFSSCGVISKGYRGFQWRCCCNDGEFCRIGPSSVFH